MFRLKQKHSQNLGQTASNPNGETLLAAQSLGTAALAAITTVLLLNVALMVSASALNRVLPWYVMIQGLFVGLAVRRWGKGLDWRFPLLAAITAWMGSYGGNFLLAADTAADEFNTGPLQIIANMSQWTLGVYFKEVVGAADHIYAFCAAILAAFYAKRRLTRREEYAFRMHRQKRSNQ